VSPHSPFRRHLGTLIASLVAVALALRGWQLQSQRDSARKDAAFGHESVQAVCIYVARMLEEEPYTEALQNLSRGCIGYTDPDETDPILAERLRGDGPALARRIRDRLAKGRLPMWLPD